VIGRFLGDEVCEIFDSGGGLNLDDWMSTFKYKTWAASHEKVQLAPQMFSFPGNKVLILPILSNKFIIPPRKTGPYFLTRVALAGGFCDPKNMA